LSVVNKSSEEIWIGGSGGALRAICVMADGDSCIPPEGAFEANGNCSCTPRQPSGGKLACPGTSIVADGGMNCATSSCNPDNTECGPGAGCNPISSPPNLCFFTLPKPTKFPIGSNPWAIPQNDEIDLCLPPAQIRNPYDGSTIFSNVWWSGGMFARSQCKPDGTQCKKTDCNGSLQSPNENCNPGTGGTNPYTQAEFTLQRTGQDYYDVEIINGADLAEEMVPIPAPTVAPPGGVNPAYWCNAAGAKTGAGSKDCSWDFSGQIKQVPLAPPADASSLLTHTLDSCVVNTSGNTQPGECPSTAYHCAGAPVGAVNGTCFLQCDIDSQCPDGLHCESAPGDTSTKYCQCETNSDCTGTSKFCGTTFVPGIKARYLQQCGDFAGWWSANDFCGAPDSKAGVGPSTPKIDCSESLTDGDNSKKTNLGTLFGCAVLGQGGDPDNHYSCYSRNNPDDTKRTCCGCPTDTLNTLSDKWPDYPSGVCKGGNNTTWAASIQPWLVNLKQACPTAYSYAYDDLTSLSGCQGEPQGPANENLLGYTITFSDLVKPPPRSK
jgi:hypothetical protein